MKELDRQRSMAGAIDAAIAAVAFGVLVEGNGGGVLRRREIDLTGRRDGAPLGMGALMHAVYRDKQQDQEEKPAEKFDRD